MDNPAALRHLPRKDEGDHTMTTGFFWDERCFWHAGGNYAFTMPVGGLVQPLAAGGLPEISRSLAGAADRLPADEVQTAS